MRKIFLSLLVSLGLVLANAIDNCFTFLMAGDLKRALEEGKKAVKFYPKNPDAHLCLGAVYYASGLFDQAFESLRRAEKFASKAENLMYIYNQIGGILYRKKNYDDALKYYMKSLSLAKNIENKKMQATILNNIGLLYQEKGDLDNALFYYMKSLELTEKEEDKAITYNNIASIYYSKGEYNKAKEFYKKAVVASELAGNLRSSGITLLNMGELYRKMKKYYLARKNLEEGIKRVKKVGDMYWTAVGYKYLGYLERELGRYERALDYFKKAKKLFLQAGASSDVKGIDFEIRLTELLKKTKVSENKK